MPFVAAAALFLALSARAELSPESVAASPTLRVSGGPSEAAMPLELANFLMDRPELAAWFARERKIARYSVNRKGPKDYAADDHRGARGKVSLLERTERSRRYYGVGEYDTPAFPTIRAGGVVALAFSTGAAPGCPESTFASYEVFLRLNSRLLSGLAQPVVPFLKGKVVQKFDRVFSVSRKIAVVLAEDPKGAGLQLASYPGLSPAEKSELERLLRRLPARSPSCLAGRSA